MGVKRVRLNFSRVARRSRPRKIRRKTYKRFRRVTRRSYRRRVGRFSRRLGIAQVFPNRRLLTHTYTCTIPTNVTVASPATVVSSPVLKINSMYDPFTGVTGAWNVTPSMYTLMATYYNNYSVIGAKCYITIRSTSQFNLAYVNGTVSGTGGGSVYPAVSIPPMRWGVFLDESGGTTLQDYPSFEPLRFHKYTHMQQTPFNAPVARLRIGYSPRKFFSALG